jgi:hypothetical protein
MMTGINLYGKSVIRERSRDREAPVGQVDEGSLVEESDAVRAFERAWALAVLNHALALVHADLAAQGRLEEFDIFRRRVVQGEAYETIAPTVGRSAQQCAGATRLVTDRLREALRNSLRDEGVPHADIDAALAEVYEVFGIARRADGGA